MNQPDYSPADTRRDELLSGLRGQIDDIDAQILPLFEQRMRVAREVAKVKGSHNLMVLDNSREQQVVDRAVALVGEDLRGEAAQMIRTLMALSRAYQRNLLLREAPLLPAPRPPVRRATCVYQGVSGAWSEQAAMQLFPEAARRPVEQFEDVFVAVKSGEGDYGVVPIENSQTGAIGITYDLLGRFGCYIVGRVGIDIRQCLLAPKGVKLAGIRQVYSHPEALGQCRSFLARHGWQQNASRNTAVAARLVADERDGHSAAIASRLAAELHGLEVLAPDIMDTAGNRTSFVVVAPQPEYDERSDTISVTFRTKHRSGALCESLLPFMAQNLDLDRIESRPAPGGEYRFFADIQGNILDSGTALALRRAAAASESFEVLGCYPRVVSASLAEERKKGG